VDESQQQRRSEDRDRDLNGRLDQLEKAYGVLTSQVAKMESSVNIVKLEQTHLKEIFDARLKVIEEGQKTQVLKFDHLADLIVSMSTDVTKSAAGRQVNGYIQQLEATLAQQAETIEKHAETHRKLKEWQDRVDTVIMIMKWIGPMGVVALGIQVIRLLARA